MAIKTQGTDLYFINPEDESVVLAGCITSIGGIDSTLEQIETTCLSGDARTYIAGLATPGTATFGINFDPQDTSHALLLSMKGVSTMWAIGWSDGTAAPTATAADSGGQFTLPNTRSWLTFEGFINSFPFNFEQNSVVQSTIGVQVSGDPVLVPKA